MPKSKTAVMPIGQLSDPRFLPVADLRPSAQKMFLMQSQCWQNRSACLQLGEVVTCGGLEQLTYRTV